MSASPEIRERWNAFVNKMRMRYGEIIGEAEAGFADLIDGDPTDALTYGNALQAIHTRVINLLQLLDATYERDVAPRANGDVTIERERHALREELERAWEARRVDFAAAIYRAMWPRVAAAMQAPVPCSKCGRPIFKTIAHRVEAISCPACKVVVQAAPAPVVSTYFGGAPHAFGEVAAAPMRQRIRDFHAARGDRAPSGPEALFALEREALVAYCTGSDAVLPMPPAERAQWLESRLQQLKARG